MNDRSDAGTSSDSVILYSKPGCGLCDEARDILDGLLDERATMGQHAPPVIERDITTKHEWEQAYFVTIPVIEIGGRRLELATSPLKIRRFLAEALDGLPAPA